MTATASHCSTSSIYDPRPLRGSCPQEARAARSPTPLRGSGSIYDPRPLRGSCPRSLAVAALVGTAAWLAIEPGAHADDDQRNRRQLVALEAREPSAAEVRHAALRHAGLDGAPDRGWARRARLSALVPRLTLRASRGLAWDEDWSGADRTVDGLDTDIAYEARAVFELDRLVFDPSEIRAATAGQQLHRSRLQLAAQVTTLWHRRRGKQILWIWHPAETIEEEVRRDGELAELTDQLDALTDGYLSEQLELPHGFSR